MRSVISDVGLAICFAVIVLEMLKRQASVRDFALSFGAALMAGLFLGLRHDEWIRGAGVGVTTGILVVFALRARSADGSSGQPRKTQQPRTVTVTLWLEAGFALAAAATFAFWNLGLAVILAAGCLLAVSAELFAGNRWRRLL